MRFFPFLLFLFLFLFACESWARRNFVVAELNAENLFDCQHDEGKDDYQYLPRGGKGWSRSRLRQKTKNLSKAIISLCDSHPADLVALLEVENRNALESLVRHSPLWKAHYQYLLGEGNDARGIDVALLYQPLTFRPIHHCELIPYYQGKPIPTRSILQVSGRLQTGDTLHVFVCHLSSKLRGKLGEEYRKAEIRQVMKRADSLFTLNPQAKIIIMGDFNDTPQSAAVSQSFASKRLVNLTAPRSDNPQVKGTYKYDGRWELLDQFIVSQSLLQDGSSLKTTWGAFQIHAPMFLLEPDASDDGLRPKRTYQGYRYHGGYSDHLPIKVSFQLTF